MGRIHFTATSYVTTLAEICGFKSGVALSLKRLRQILLADRPDAHAWPTSLQSAIGVRFEEFEATVHHILYSLGSIRHRNPSLLPHEFLRELARDPSNRTLTDDLMRAFFEATRRSTTTAPGQPIDLTPAVEEMARLHGLPGIDITMRLIDATAEAIEGSPWGRSRGIEWEDVVNLDDLFHRENLSTAHGRYFDLRFINYLHRNFGDIDRVNWRMFEKLTAEFFEQAGFDVALGPGRGDGGIDVRATLTTNGRSLTVLVQCKRYQENIGPGVVKELWAEVDWERTVGDERSVGLVVTTSRFTPGAHDMIAVRRYPILEADRECLMTWIDAMQQTRNPIL